MPRPNGPFPSTSRPNGPANRSPNRVGRPLRVAKRLPAAHCAARGPRHSIVGRRNPLGKPLRPRPAFLRPYPAAFAPSARCLRSTAGEKLPRRRAPGLAVPPTGSLRSPRGMRSTEQESMRLGAWLKDGGEKGEGGRAKGETKRPVSLSPLPLLPSPLVLPQERRRIPKDLAARHVDFPPDTLAAAFLLR